MKSIISSRVGLWCRLGLVDFSGVGGALEALQLD